jgi:hypothetical protein
MGGSLRGRQFTLHSFLITQVAHIYVRLLFPLYKLRFRFEKMGWVTVWAFFTNSPGTDVMIF